MLTSVGGPSADPAPSAFAATAERSLQLEVFVNDRPVGLIAAFTQGPDGRMRATRGELAEIGVKATGDGPKDAAVALDDIAGLHYVYEERKQIIRLRLDGQARLARDYGADAPAAETPKPEANWAAVLNYNLFSSTLTQLNKPKFEYQGASATLDGRISTPMGVISQTGIVGSNIASSRKALRLDTNWTWSDPRSLITYRAGDTISSGLAWTRPVRMGGAQIQRNFGLRPDLVTLPLPSLGGTAAVPSTLDVYVNNVKTFTQQVDEGPYRVNSLPLVGSGTAKIVVRDSTGRETQQESAFFTSPLLLRPGLFDFSVEAGLARRSYGVESNDYARGLIGSASARRGLAQWLTIEGHLEGGPKFVNAGAGLVVRVFDRGVVNLAASASRSAGANGGQLYGSFETRLGPVTVSGASQRSFGRYEDLASLTAVNAPKTIGGSVADGGVGAFAELISIRPMRALDRIALSFPTPFDSSSVSLAFTRMVTAERKRTTIASASWSRPGPWGSSMFATGYVSVAGAREAGVFAGFAMPIGKDAYGAASVSTVNGRVTTQLEAAKSLGQTPGDYGWRLRDVEGANGGLREAGGAYRSQWARVEANVGQERKTARASLEVEGAVAAIGGGVFAANCIGDAFAVIDAGAPGVEVKAENRAIGRTDSRGKLLVPTLRAYERNAISIDPRSLPVDADAARTQATVTPAGRSGVVVDFGVKTDVQGAVVVVVDAAGKPLRAGSHARLEGAQAPLVVGYEGRVYVTGLGPRNRLRVAQGAGECAADFAYARGAGPQPVIGPVVCR